MICHKHQAIFIHIQKTGGNSVSAVLGMSGSERDKHWLAVDLKKSCADTIWNSYFKFSIVRNPWDRLVSWYVMIDRHRQAFDAGAPLNRFQAAVLERAKSFGDFLQYMDEEIVDDDGPKWIYRNQIDYLLDERGQLLVDFIARTERLQADFMTIRSRLAGSPGPLPHINRSSHRHYTEYYTPLQARLVGERFARDIEYLGYRFGD